MQGLSLISSHPLEQIRNVRLLPESRSPSPAGPPCLRGFFVGVRWTNRDVAPGNRCPDAGARIAWGARRERTDGHAGQRGRGTAFIGAVPKFRWPGRWRDVRSVRAVRVAVGTGAARVGGLFRAAGA